MNILSIQSSSRDADTSVTRRLSETLIERLSAKTHANVVRREADDGVPAVSTAWTQAAYTAEVERTPEQREALRISDELVAELQAADTLVIGAPIYNFGVPAALKLWIDQVCRAGVTFRYSENGPVGLLDGKKAYVVVASGGTAAGSAIDFATPYMRHVLGFIGITDVEFITADQLMVNGDGTVAAAREQIERLAA